MKKIFLFLALLPCFLKAQQAPFYLPWSPFGNTLGNNTSFLGSIDNRSFKVFTNNSYRTKWDSLGNIYHLGNLMIGATTNTDAVNFGVSKTSGVASIGVHSTDANSYSQIFMAGSNPSYYASQYFSGNTATGFTGLYSSNSYILETLSSNVLYNNAQASGTFIWATQAYATSTVTERMRIAANSNISIAGASTVKTYTPLAFVDLSPGTTSFPPLRLQVGVAPTTPTNGSIWMEPTTTNGFSFYSDDATNNGYAFSVKNSSVTSAIYMNHGTGIPCQIGSSSAHNVGLMAGGSVYLTANTSGRIYIGGGNSSTAIAQLAAGNATTSAILLTTQTDFTTGTLGAIWYNSTSGINFTGGLSTGQLNTLFGYRALNSITTASNCAAFGTNALFANLSANGCSAFGKSALTAITTGANNSGFGSNVMAAMVGGSLNVAMGSSAMITATAGNANTWIGYAAGTAQTSGDDNTGLGRNAGTSLTTGTGNIFLGRMSGNYVTTLINRIFINSIDRSNLAQDSTNSPFYVYQHSTVANQRIYINGKAFVSNTLTIGALAGTTTNDNTSAGNVGEYTSSLIAVGSAVSFTTATAMNITTISVTAGDWDIEGNVNFNETSSTVSARSAGVTSTSATIPTDGSQGYCGVQSTVTSEINTITLPRKRVSVSGTTTIYLVGSATFAAGTCTGFGTITARRVR